MNGGAVLVAITLATCVVGIFLISIAMTGYFLRPLGAGLRLVAGGSGLLLWMPVDAFGKADLVVAAKGLL